MKNALALALLIVSLSFPAAVSARSPFGLGVVIGSPTGLAGNLYLGKGRSVAGALGWSLGGEDSFQFQADYLFHKPRAFAIDNEVVHWYFGGGVRLIRWDHNNLYWKGRDADYAIGVRAPIGLKYNFRNTPVDVFLEAALIMDVLPDTDLDADVALGARFYF